MLWCDGFYSSYICCRLQKCSGDVLFTDKYADFMMKRSYFYLIQLLNVITFHISSTHICGSFLLKNKPSETTLNCVALQIKTFTVVSIMRQCTYDGNKTENLFCCVLLWCKVAVAEGSVLGWIDFSELNSMLKTIGSLSEAAY